MPKILSLPNLHRFIDTLLAEGVRVVGPKRTGTLTVYAPLAKGDELELTEQPRRSAKEVFFPPCETILSFEKCDGKTMVTDPDLDRLPETVLIGVRPCDAAAPGILDAVFSWDYDDPFYLERRKRTTIVGIACTSSDDACFCTAVGCSPDARKGSDLFLLPIEGGGFVVEALDAKGSALKARYESLLDTVGNARQVPLATPDVKGYAHVVKQDPVNRDLLFVGDSRTYLFRNGLLRLITRDHSVVASLVAEGQLHPEEIYLHPQRNVIYRYLGQKGQVLPDIFQHLLQPGDQLLLCSDGLWEMIRSEQELAELMAKAGDPKQACRDLVQAANRLGGEDNISAVVVKAT
jgi:hypothetical protein